MYFFYSNLVSDTCRYKHALHLNFLNRILEYPKNNNNKNWQKNINNEQMNYHGRTFNSIIVVAIAYLSTHIHKQKIYICFCVCMYFDMKLL